MRASQNDSEKLTLVNRLEAGLLAVIKAGGELDLRDGAASEVANARAGRRGGGRGGGGRARRGCCRRRRSSSVGSGTRSGGGRARGRASDDVALVIDSGDGGEVCLDTEDGVECVGLSTSLCGLRIGRSASRLAGGLRGRVSTAAVGQRVANELRDDVDVLGRAVVVRGCENNISIFVNLVNVNHLLLSTGWKLVSLRLSKPVANSIWGTVQLPKLPIPVEEGAAAAALPVAVLVEEPAMMLPWSSTAATAEKSVWMPKTALNASA